MVRWWWCREMKEIFAVQDRPDRLIWRCFVFRVSTSTQSKGEREEKKEGALHSGVSWSQCEVRRRIKSHGRSLLDHSDSKHSAH